MESQPKNPEFRNYPENFHPCDYMLIGFEDYNANMVPEFLFNVI